MTNSAPRFPHQIKGTEALLEHPALMLAWRPGRSKSRTVIDAACALYRDDKIDTMLVVAPANLRSIWADEDPTLGETAKWMWPGTPYTVSEYRAKTKLSKWRPEGLAVLVTNFEFLRRDERLDPLITWARGRRVLLVIDESWAISNPRAQQTKAVYRLRQACQRVVLLNGTPGEPKQQYSQLMTLDKKIFDGQNFWAWRARYCRLGGFGAKQIVGYINEDEYARRTAPYVQTEDGDDAFAQIAPPVRTQIEARLTPATWKIYKDLREDFVAWLSDTSAATALQAGVRALRLAQVVNGFVGGVEEDGETSTGVREIGDEKLRAIIQFLDDEGVPDKVLIFTRFRLDVERTVRVLAETYPNHRVLPIYGTQDPAERREAKQLLAPGGDPRKAIIVANAKSGGAGLNLAAASLCIFLGNEYELLLRVQAEGRVDRTGQTQQVRFVDILGVGPEGQKTIDHLIASSLRKKEAISLTTLAAWRKILSEE